MSSPARSTFMHQFVRDLARQHVGNFPQNDPRTKRKLLARIRADLAERARSINLPDAEFEKRFATKIAPAFHDVAESVLAGG